MVIPISHRAVGILLLNSHTSFFLPSFTPLWTTEDCDKCLNSCICSLLPSTTSWILNGSCLIHCCRMSGILQKMLRASSLSVEGKRQRLIWNLLYHSAHAKISAIQQVIRNAKKTWGKWEYLRGKVTLRPPSGGAYALCVPVCMENKQRPESCCIVILFLLLHSVFHSFLFYTCSLVSSATSQSLIISKVFHLNRLKNLLFFCLYCSVWQSWYGSEVMTKERELG